MPDRVYSTLAEGNTTLVTTAETVVATLNGVTTSRPGQLVRLQGAIQITTGTATTGLTMRIRRDSLTGTQVGEANTVQVEAAAGSTEDHDYDVEDSFSGEVAGQTYVLTVAQTGASANGSVLRASLSAAIDE